MPQEDDHHHDGHAHKHHGHSHGIDPEAGDWRVAGAIAVNVVLTLAQIVGGIFSGSLALIADALHNFSDVVSLIIAFAARKIARRPSDETMTFGYGRAEVVAALINYTTLIIVGLYLAYEAVMRFIEPQPVDGWLVVIIAGIALVVDLATAALTYTMSKTSMNIRAAFLHNVADALGSVAVIIGGTLILLYDWRLVDPIITLMISAYILWHTFCEIGGSIRLLMLGSPLGLVPQDVIVRLKQIDGVSDVHHAHFWQIDEHKRALDTHLVIAAGSWIRADEIKARAKDVLKAEFSIVHSTLEMECAEHACSDAAVIGEAPN